MAKQTTFTFILIALISLLGCNSDCGPEINGKSVYVWRGPLECRGHETLIEVNDGQLSYFNFSFQEILQFKTPYSRDCEYITVKPENSEPLQFRFTNSSSLLLERSGADRLFEKVTPVDHGNLEWFYAMVFGKPRNNCTGYIIMIENGKLYYTPCPKGNMEEDITLRKDANELIDYLAEKLQYVDTEFLEVCPDSVMLGCSPPTTIKAKFEDGTYISRYISNHYMPIEIQYIIDSLAVVAEYNREEFQVVKIKDEKYFYGY